MSEEVNTVLPSLWHGRLVARQLGSGACNEEPCGSTCAEHPLESLQQHVDTLSGNDLAAEQDRRLDRRLTFPAGLLGCFSIRIQIAEIRNIDDEGPREQTSVDLTGMRPDPDDPGRSPERGLQQSPSRSSDRAAPVEARRLAPEGPAPASEREVAHRQLRRRSGIVADHSEVSFVSIDLAQDTGVQVCRASKRRQGQARQDTLDRSENRLCPRTVRRRRGVVEHAYVPPRCRRQGLESLPLVGRRDDREEQHLAPLHGGSPTLAGRFIAG